VTGRRIVTSPANERGGHSRPRRPFAPRPRGNGRHDNRHEAGRRGNGVPGQAAVVPELDGNFPLGTGVNAGINDSAGVVPGTPGLSSPDGSTPDAAGLPPGLPEGRVPGGPVPGGPVPGAPAGLPAGLVPSPSGEPGYAPAVPGDLAAYAPGPPGAPPAPPGYAPVPPGLEPGFLPGQADLVPGQGGTGPQPQATGTTRPSPGRTRPARPGAPGSGSTGRRPSAPSRQSRRAKVAALAIVVIGVLVIGLASGFGSELSAEPNAQAFLYSWQQQQYAAAARLTTGEPGRVTTSMRTAATQLDATQLFMSLKSVVQHGGTADVSFTATVDLAQQGRVWTYDGHFGMRRVNGDWKVVWAPSVINPRLGPGERLAVVTAFPARAAVLDAAGKPLQLPARAYVLGVWPDRLSDPAQTARAFAKYTKLQAGQVLGQIAAAPPQQFLRLATLDPGSYASVRASLRRVPGLVVRPESQRLFQAEATGLVGAVGSELSEQLRADGALYAPGTTIGLSGLEQKYQRQLLGTPTTEVVVVNSAGQQTGVLARWKGVTGTPVQTTISSAAQNAALDALNEVPNSGELVAVKASTGEVLAVAQHQASGVLPAAGALNARLVPGGAFTIVSAGALLRHGVSVKSQTSCAGSFTVGGQTFTSEGTGQQKPFSAVFADGCSTAFAGLSERLSASQWAQVIKEFGIGASWSQLPVPAFSGSVPPAAGDDATLAAQTIGHGNVRMSLLSMAMVAAAVDAGSWHVPQVIKTTASPQGGTPLDPDMTKALQGLMRGAVRSGAAQAARLPGPQVYGQVGMVRTGSGWMSWFVGYRGDTAIAAIESGRTGQLSAAALAGAFFSALGR
jgi:cell division protein FtsI/penicillin-binding protein 2